MARTNFVTDQSSRDRRICLHTWQLFLIDWHIGKVELVSVIASLVDLFLELFVLKLFFNDHFNVFDVDVGTELLNWISLVFLAGINVDIGIGLIIHDLLLHLQAFPTVLRIQSAIFGFPHAC